MTKRAHDQKAEQPALSPDLDPRLVLERLSPEERVLIGGWLEELGLEPDDWPVIPPFRSLVELLAIIRTAEVEPKNTAAAIRRAAEQLGMQDNERATHLADRYGRRLSRWDAAARSYRAASRAKGQNVCPPEAGAA